MPKKAGPKESFIRIDLPSNIYQLSEQGLKGTIHLQVDASLESYDVIEMEMIGVEETKWVAEKRKPKGEFAFFHQKHVLFQFPPEWKDRAGQYNLPFTIRLPGNLPSSLSYIHPGVCGAQVQYSLMARFKQSNPLGIAIVQAKVLECELPFFLVRPLARP